MDEQKKVRIQLEKHLWPDEIIEKKRKRRSAVIMVILCLTMFCMGITVGVKSGITSSSGPAFTVQSGSASMSKVESIYNILRKNWFFAAQDENIDETLIDNALYGMSQSETDLHTTYMSRQEVESFTTGIDYGFVGIGVQYSTASDLNLITRVFHNSPADKAGVLPGDIIYSVDGVLAETLTSDEISDRVKGIEGTDVVMGFMRDNELIEITITRGAVNNTAYGEMVDDTVGYLQLYSFGSSTAEEVAGYLEMMTEQGLKKLILDLRDNGGGYLEALVGVSGSFFPQGTIVMKEVYADGKVEYAKAGKGMFKNIEEIVVLVNGATASASEVLTMALKEQRDDVTILGTKTYGKGTVQVTHTFADGSALKYTTAKWTSPNDVWLHGEGITPDIELYLHDILYRSYILMEEGTEIKVDSVSSYVSLIQEALDFLGYSIERDDGYFDKSTQNALIQFQNEFSIENKGVLDSESLEAILAQVTKMWSLEKSTDWQLQKAIEVLHE